MRTLPGDEITVLAAISDISIKSSKSNAIARGWKGWQEDEEGGEDDLDGRERSSGPTFGWLGEDAIILKSD